MAGPGAQTRTSPPAAPPGLGTFFDAVRDTNPFAAVRINEPSAYDVDVPAINADSFHRLVDLADLAHRERVGVGAVLYGGAGIGKSHLLSRLYRWANKEGNASYVFLHNILADPERLPRYVLKCVVGALSRGSTGARPPLVDLVYDAVVRSFTRRKIAKADWKQFELEHARLIDQSAEGWRVREPAFHREVHAVLLRYFRLARLGEEADPAARVAAEAAVQWLSGDEIDPAAAKALGLSAPGNRPIMLRGDDEVEQVLLALFQLAHACGRPFVLCLDQIEVLDADKLRSLSKFLQVVIDHAVNLLVVVSGVKQSLIEIRETIISEAAWDRVAEYKVEPRRIGPDDARRIVEARLEKFHESFVGLDAVKRRFREDALFPLGRRWLDGQLADGLEFRPRQVLMWARDAWEERREELARLGGESWLAGWPGEGRDDPEPPPPIVEPTRAELEAAVDAAVDRKIEEAIAQRRLHRGSLPPDAGNLAGLVLSLLEQCRGDGLPYTFRDVERTEKGKGKLPPYDLLVREERREDKRAIRTGVLFVTSTGPSATAALKRLLEDDRPDHRILVTDEERRPMNLRPGTRGYEYYGDLQALGADGFEHVKLDFEQYAGLDALDGVVKLAQAGDLDVEVPRGTIRPVSADEVVASHHRSDRYRSHPLLRPLLTEEAAVLKAVGPRVIRLDEQDVRRHINAQLAWRLGMSASEATAGYLKARPSSLGPDEARAQIKAIAGRMHAEGLIHADPQDDDLFLQRRA